MKYYLFIFICFLWLNFIYLNRAVYITPYNIGFWQHEFLNTQIVKGDKAKRWYSDTEIYAITGYKYIRGENPTQIHPEVPPAGKLLIGGSIILFGNENLGNLILGFASLVLIYLLGRHMFSGHSPAALLAVLLTSLDPGFRASLTTANIDIPQLLFLLSSLWAFLKAQNNPFWFGFSSFGLGLMMATKFYATAGVLFAVYCVFLLIKGRFKPFIYFFISLPAAFFGLALPYFSAFREGMTLSQFWHFQGWLASWWAGNARVPWGGIFPIIFQGRWYTWWGTKEIVRVGEWTPLWPIALVLSVFLITKFMSIKNLKLKIKNYPILLLWLWSFAYLAFLSFTSPFPRYLIPLTPFFYILSICFLKYLSHPRVS